jgi:hypothetical protein
MAEAAIINSTARDCIRAPFAALYRYADRVLSGLLVTSFFSRLRPAHGCAGIFKHGKRLKMKQNKNRAFLLCALKKCTEGLFPTNC